MNGHVNICLMVVHYVINYANLTSGNFDHFRPITSSISIHKSSGHVVKPRTSSDMIIVNLKQFPSSLLILLYSKDKSVLPRDSFLGVLLPNGLADPRFLSSFI